MKTNLLVAAFCCLASGALADDLTWNDLARRPEFWPAQCTLKRTMTFQQATVNAGQKVDVLAIRPNQIELATARGLTFAAKPEDTDALPTAAAAWKSLTPAQRALTFSTLLQRTDLWPYRVKLTQPANLGNVQIDRGESVILTSTEGNRFLVVSERANTLFDVDPRDTNVLEHARKAIESKAARTGRYTEELQGKLVNATTGASVALSADAEPRYYLFYRGASWCGPCRQFSPTLVKFYQRAKAAHPEFETILISDDKDPADMKKYAQEEGFAWPAVPATNFPKLKIINPLFGNTIPQLVVTDRHGKVLIDSNRTGREQALAQFETLLSRPVAAE